MDSGAARSISAPSIASGVPIEGSGVSKAGQCFISASNQRIPDMGQQSLRMVTTEGTQGKAFYQIGEVNRPLTSVTQTCDAGNLVIYASEGGYTYILVDGSRTYFGRHSIVYELDQRLKTEDTNGSVDKPGA